MCISGVEPGAGVFPGGHLFLDPGEKPPAEPSLVSRVGSAAAPPRHDRRASTRAHLRGPSRPHDSGLRGRDQPDEEETNK